MHAYIHTHICVHVYEDACTHPSSMHGPAIWDSHSSPCICNIYMRSCDMYIKFDTQYKVLEDVKGFIGAARASKHVHKVPERLHTVLICFDEVPKGPGTSCQLHVGKIPSSWGPQRTRGQDKPMATKRYSTERRLIFAPWGLRNP